MSDSSEEEDLSRFKEAVDTTFVKLIDESRGKTYCDKIEKQQSQRYIDESTHYNDVKVSDELQRRIGAKVSAIIHKNIEFVNIENKVKKRKIKGGVKLFRDSEDFLSCEELKDTSTELHNSVSKKIKKKKRVVDEVEELDENDKINAVAVSAEHVLSKVDTKHWGSCRKEKIFKYKKMKNSNVHIEIK